MGGSDEVLFFRMALDVSRKEGADRDHLEAALARRVEREADQRGPDALALVSRRNFGVREQNYPWPQAVLGNRERAIAKVDLEPLFFGIVSDWKIGRLCHE